MGRNGDGVRAASKTTIEISFSYKGERCRERVQLKPTPANLKKAARHRAAIIEAISNNVFDYERTFPNSPRSKNKTNSDEGALTLDKYLIEWLERKKPELMASTYNDYRKTVFNILIPIFGDCHPDNLKRKDIKDYAAKLTCSSKRISNILSPLRLALQEAEDDELIEVNPIHGWSYKKLESPKEDHIDPFSSDEQVSILAALSGQGRNLIQFAFWTGLRTSELIALRWSDIDWVKGCIRVTRKRTQAGQVDEIPKTSASRREVKLLKPAILALQSQKRWTYITGLHVFINPKTDEPWEGDQAIRKTLWSHALKKAGVAYRNPYQTRHTYASMQLSSGEHPMWVATQMGHSDWTMIARRYGKWMPDADPDSGSRAVNVYGNSLLVDSKV